jgi:hypothetical protein
LRPHFPHGCMPTAEESRSSRSTRVLACSAVRAPIATRRIVGRRPRRADRAPLMCMPTVTRWGSAPSQPPITTSARRAHPRTRVGRRVGRDVGSGGAYVFVVHAQAPGARHSTVLSPRTVQWISIGDRRGPEVRARSRTSVRRSSAAHARRAFEPAFPPTRSGLLT